MTEPVRYHLVNGDNPCDICVAAAGPYVGEPDVPLHPGCDCTVVAARPGEECHEEIRNLRISPAEWERFETVEHGACDDDSTLGGQVLDGENEIGRDLLESFDTGVEEAARAAGWSPPAGANLDVAYDIPDNSTYEVTAAIKVKSWLFVGDRWLVCVAEDPVAGIHVSERMIGSAGGFHQQNVEARLESVVDIGCEPDWDTA